MSAPVLETVQLSKRFILGKGHFLDAVQAVSLSLFAGETLGLGGESGCGKSTLVRLLMGLLQPTAGTISFQGGLLASSLRQRSAGQRREMQLIFQHPGASLNPRLTVEELLAEPLIIHRLHRGAERSQLLAALLEQVGLPPSYLRRWPHELSGGQKQRVAIARALALGPRVLIGDEPFSALDAAVQVQILELLRRLQREQGLSYLMISHDLAVLRYLSHRLAIMYAGRIVEYGPAGEVYQQPAHPYTQALTAAALPLHPLERPSSWPLKIAAEAPARFCAPEGCPFYRRCPRAQGICRTMPPPWREVRPHHFAACHF